MRRMTIGISLLSIIGIVAGAISVGFSSNDARSQMNEAIVPSIVVDQFGYLPDATKIAVVREPKEGFDAGSQPPPGESFALVDATTGAVVLEGKATPWNDGAIDDSSGDRAAWFDFSSVSAPGSYYVRGVTGEARSPTFRIDENVYREVLVHAVRTFFYQRAGFEKRPEHAGAAWADGASHIGPGQDANARLYSAPDDPRTERDLSGGWYDAGDYNKYTSWTARYLIALLMAYKDNPAAFTDDFGIPESGNGIPDLIDEVKWGMDWLVRMQEGDGSVLSIMGMAHASPPSAAKGPSLYGSASTTATLAAAGAYALGATVFRSLGQVPYADDLLARAKSAYAWADANPDVLFRNNDADWGTQGLAAGQQETDEYGRHFMKLRAAAFLFAETGEELYRAFVDENYTRMRLIESRYVYPFEAEEQDLLLYYANLPGASPEVAQDIRDAFRTGMEGEENFGAVREEKDPYRAYLKHYTWGSNGIKAAQGNVFQQLITYGIDPSANSKAEAAALGYVHYLHGVNPLGMVYLTNMYAQGAESSANEIYHSWFAAGNAKWGRVGVATYGPAPGFLVGGPNPSYSPAECCPKSCGNFSANAMCPAQSLSPPQDQPPQKSYKDFGAGWPLNSWEVSENSNQYQVAYIRLLSKFVK